jgi:hypothetical protein
MKKILVVTLCAMSFTKESYAMFQEKDIIVDDKKIIQPVHKTSEKTKDDLYWEEIDKLFEKNKEHMKVAVKNVEDDLGLSNKDNRYTNY